MPHVGTKRSQDNTGFAYSNWEAARAPVLDRLRNGASKHFKKVILNVYFATCFPGLLGFLVSWVLQISLGYSFSSNTLLQAILPTVHSTPSAYPPRTLFHCTQSGSWL